MNIDSKKYSRRELIIIIIAILGIPSVSTPVVAGDACGTASAIELAAPMPTFDCHQSNHEVYKESVMQGVFKAKTLHADVDDKIAAVKNGLTEEQSQASHIDHVSDDSIVRGRVKIRNQTNTIVNFSADPTGRAEQSVGAIR